MRALQKGATPAVLAANGVAWTVDYVSASTDEERKRLERWRHPEIKQALSAETDAKCAYCEGFIDDVAYGHVEHIVPKAVRRDLAHEWANMTRACPVCNGKKGDYYVVGMELLNPYVDLVASRLLHFGDFIDWALGDARAEVTVTRLELNRLSLIRARCTRLMAVRQLLERWFVSDEPQKTLLADAIQADAEEGEYTSTVLAFLRARGFAANVGGTSP